MAQDYYAIEPPAAVLDGEDKPTTPEPEAPPAEEPEMEEEEEEGDDIEEGGEEEDSSGSSSAVVPITFAGNAKPEPGDLIRLRVVSVSEDGIEVEPLNEGKKDWDREIEEMDTKKG